MARGVELATGYISLVAETGELAEQVKKDLKRVEQHAQQTGKSMGKQMRQGIEQELRNVKTSFSGRSSSGSAQSAGRSIGQQVNRGIEQSVGRINPRISLNPASAQSAGRMFGTQLASSVSSTFGNAVSTMLPNSMVMPLQRAGGGLSGMTAGLGAATLAAGATTAAIAGVGLAAGALGVASVKAGIDYTKTLNNMQAVTGATAEQMKVVSDRAMALGRDNELAGSSAEDAALAMAELSKGGFQVQQSMDAARGTLQLATAAGIGAGEAAVIQSNALNAFGLSADKASYVADVLANAANKSSGEMTDFAYGLQAGSSVAQQFGMSIDETVSTLAMLANVGIKSSDAGTLMKSALLNMASPSEQAANAMAELGLKIWDAQGNFVGMATVFEQLHTAAKTMTPEMYAMYTSTALGSDAARLAGVAAEVGAAGFDKMTASLNQQGAAAQVAAAQTQGMPGVIERISNTWSDLKLSLFGLLDGPVQALGNTFQEALAGVVSWLNANKPEIIGFFTDALNAAMLFFEGTIRTSATMTRILSNTLGTAIEGIAKFASTIGNIMSKVPEFIAPGIKQAGEQLKKIGDFTDDAMDTWQGFGDVLDGTADKMDKARKNLTATGEAAQNSAEFVRDLGGAAAEVTEGQGVIVHDNSPEFIQRMESAGYSVEQIPNTKDVRVTADTAEAEARLNAFAMQDFTIGGNIALNLKDAAGNPISFPDLQNLIGGNFGGTVNIPAAVGGGGAAGGGGFVNYDPARGMFGGSFAKGGDVKGGEPGRDSVLAALMPGEHVLDTTDVAAMGGQGGVYLFRQMLKDGAIPGFEEGGAVGGARNMNKALYDKYGATTQAQKRAIDFAFAQSGKPYDYGGTGGPGDSFDCSGIASSTWAAMVGLPTSKRYFTTESDFAKLGFKPGFKPGALNVGIQRGGGGPNSHMALTLPNGVSMESGGAHGSVMYGQNAAGALNEQFALHYYFDPAEGTANFAAAAGGGDDNGDGMILEDESGWNWATMGNKRGPGGVTAQDLGVGGAGAGSGLSEDPGRGAGFIPAAAGGGGVAGTSFVSGLLNMGGEAVKGVIDQAASAASSAAGMAIGAGTMGAGAAGGSQAGAAAAQFAIGMATNAAKRGVDFGFQMAGIASDALIEQLTPFGTPRWLGYDYTTFLPQLSPQGAAVTTGEAAAAEAGTAQKVGPTGQSGSGWQGPVVAKAPPMAQPQLAGGQPSAPGMAAPRTAGGPVQPNQLPGMGAQTTPVAPPDGWQRRLGIFDDGGWLKPGQAALNLSGQPEPVLTGQQWDAIKGATQPPSGGSGSSNDYSIRIENLSVSDVGALKRELDDKQMLQMMRYAGRP